MNNIHKILKLDNQEYTSGKNICQPIFIINKRGKRFSFFYTKPVNDRSNFCAFCRNFAMGDYA